MDRDLSDGDALNAMLGLVPVSDQEKTRLREFMSAPDRHYHNTRHIADLWRRHVALRAGTGMDATDVEPRLSAAILWHDSIYIAGRPDNEQRSAALWFSAAHGSDLPALMVEWVAAAITAPADHVTPRSQSACQGDQALQWLLDLDLTPLGEAPEQFARDTARLGRENAGNPDQHWQERRVEFLRRIAACPRIFLNPAIAAGYEKQARDNIARELSPGTGMPAGGVVRRP